VKKLVLVPLVAVLAYASPVPLLPNFGGSDTAAAPGEAIEAAVLQAERDKEAAQAAASPFA
jgi:hypothetical protein